MKTIAVLTFIAFGSVLAFVAPPATLTQQDQAASPPPSNKTVGQDERAADDPQKAQPKSLDITKKVLEYNDPKKFATPPTQFRKGHVRPRKLDNKAITPGKDGFSIQLPSKAPIPTVTFYQGRLYVSGGFHSKEYYCFDANNGKLVWAIDLDDDGPSAAVCQDNICVFNTESCTIFAVDCSTGKQLWSWWLGDPLMSTPTIANGLVFTSYPASGRSSSNEQKLGGGAFNNANPAVQSAQNQVDQAQVQQAQIQQAQVQQSAKQEKAKQEKKKGGQGRKQDEGKKPAPPGQTHVLCCLDLKTGKILWQKWIDSDVMSAPIAEGDELFVTSFAGTLYKLNQKDGSILSAKSIRATSAPLIVQGDVVVSKRADAESGDKTGKPIQVEESIVSLKQDLKTANAEFNRQSAHYLDRKIQSKTELNKHAQQLDAGNGFSGGAPQQANPAAAIKNIGYANVSTLQAFQGSRNLHYRGLFLSCPGDKIICNQRDGKKLWSISLKGDLKKVGGMLAAPPIQAGGQIFVSTLKGEILQIDPKTGEIRKKYAIGSPLRFPPIVQDGNLYVGTQDGKMVCIKTGDKKLTGWTTWGGNAAHNKN